jgi:hypothetical protein
MALKMILATLDGLDEVTKALYKAVEGKFHLDVEGAVQKEKLDEFRNTNLNQVEEIKQLKASLESYKGVDPVKYKELQAQMSTLEEKKLLGDGKIDDVINLRTARMKADYEEQLSAKDKVIKAQTDEKAQAFIQRDQFIIDTELRRAVDKQEFGFQAGVADLLKPQVLSEFTFREGKIVRVKPDGSVVYGKNGDPASIAEFLTDVIKERPYLAKTSNGSGAPPGGGNKNAGTGKTMTRATFETQPAHVQMAFAKEGGKVTD